MGDPTGGGRYEVLEDDADAGADDSEHEEEDENRNQPSTSATSSSVPVRRLRRRAKLVTSIKLEDVRAEDDAAEDDVRDDDVVGSGSRGSRGFFSSTLGLVGASRGRRRVRDRGSRRRAVVDGVTVSAHDGQVLALLGHAGSGASETLEVMSGRRPRSAGSMEFRGAPVPARWSPARFGASVGLCPSRDALEGLLTPREHLAFAARVHRQTISSASASAMNAFHAFASAEDRDATEGLLREAGVGEGHAPNTPVESLDPGARRALQVALAFVGAALPRPRGGSRRRRRFGSAFAESRGPPGRSHRRLRGSGDATRDVGDASRAARGADDGGVGDAKRRRGVRRRGPHRGDESRTRQVSRRTHAPEETVRTRLQTPRDAGGRRRGRGRGRRCRRGR